jgi:hypothetical protein
MLGFTIARLGDIFGIFYEQYFKRKFMEKYFTKIAQAQKKGT